MYFNLRCIACASEIQVEYQYIGEWIECPICKTVQVTPDPLLLPGTEHYGYQVITVIDSNFLWTVYHAVGDTELPDRDVLLKIPSTFFTKD